MSDMIDYGEMMHQAMRGLIRQVLEKIAHDGLPGQHHLFISFDTSHPDVQVADWLAERYPDEMTIVIQHWFDNLDVTDQGFAITLNFGDHPEPLYIPYDAILTFVDPSVEFGLRFDAPQEENHAPLHDVSDPVEEAPMAEDAVDEDEDAAPRDAEIVSLDSFRKP
ncbi:MAG: hypothetical protein CSA68_04825 [Rhodobacterales bacterium]|nr:MAG: hypothetical protein CSA68_04825 [Rhodobacterales bacterium]